MDARGRMGCWGGGGGGEGRLRVGTRLWLALLKGLDQEGCRCWRGLGQWGCRWARGAAGARKGQASRLGCVACQGTAHGFGLVRARVDAGAANAGWWDVGGDCRGVC